MAADPPTSDAEDVFDPFRSPQRRVLAIAHVVLPVVLARVGGRLRITEEDHRRLLEGYGKRVAVQVTQDGDGYLLVLSSATERPAPPQT